MYFKLKKKHQETSPTCNIDVYFESPLTKSDQLNLFIDSQTFLKELAFYEEFPSK